MTPAKAVEQVRLDAARSLLEASQDSIESVAETAGFGDSERMRRAFRRTSGEPPQAFRRAARTLDPPPPLG